MTLADILFGLDSTHKYLIRLFLCCLNIFVAATPLLLEEDLSCPSMKYFRHEILVVPHTFRKLKMFIKTLHESIRYL